MATAVLRHREVGRSVWRPWTIAWLGGSVLGIANGTIRELVYTDRVGELTAHYLSTVILIVLLALYFLWLDNRWRLPSARTALKIGAVWAVLTASFDFIFGYYVDGKSWAELAKDYDLSDGRVWIAVLVWLVVGPAAARAVHRRSLAPR